MFNTREIHTYIYISLVTCGAVTSKFLCNQSGTVDLHGAPPSARPAPRSPGALCRSRCMCVYIYIYVQKEREREIHTYGFIYRCIYSMLYDSIVHIYIYIYSMTQYSQYRAQCQIRVVEYIIVWCMILQYMIRISIIIYTYVCVYI